MPGSTYIIFDSYFEARIYTSIPCEYSRVLHLIELDNFLILISRWWSFNFAYNSIIIHCVGVCGVDEGGSGGTYWRTHMRYIYISRLDWLSKTKKLILLNGLVKYYAFLIELDNLAGIYVCMRWIYCLGNWYGEFIISFARISWVLEKWPRSFATWCEHKWKWITAICGSRMVRTFVKGWRRRRTRLFL